ncbi:MAG TPA: hypothetical protein VJK07_02440 [Candidatus Nanoarchaeia archaeon]|nr:hypothetical protein [Candidatus Nanoarchaeia archaeon]
MARDIPLSEITLRRYEKPYASSKRELVKKTCLSLGLLQPGDSRDIIVDIMLALDIARKEKTELTSFDIIDKVKGIRKQHNLEERGLAESNVRRQLKRLRDLMLVDKRNNLYRLSEFESLSHLFAHKIEGFLIPQTIERVKDYLSQIDNADDRP